MQILLGPGACRPVVKCFFRKIWIRENLQAILLQTNLFGKYVVWIYSSNEACLGCTAVLWSFIGVRAPTRFHFKESENSYMPYACGSDRMYIAVTHTSRKMGEYEASCPFSMSITKKTISHHYKAEPLNEQYRNRKNVPMNRGSSQ